MKRDMRYKSLIIILSVLILFFSLFIFWQREDFFSLWKREPSEMGAEGSEGGLSKSKPEGSPEEFEQLYILEIPPQSKYLAEAGSERFWEALQSGGGIIVQDSENVLSALLQLFDVQYVLLRDEKYWELFEPFLNYSPGEEKKELPRTFPVKKETLASSSEPFLILGKGWYEQWEDDHGLVSRWFGEEATIQYVIPPGTLNKTPNLLTFSALWSPLPEEGKKAEIEVIVNGKRIYSSDSCQWEVLQLGGLQEGINEIKLRSSQGCIIPEGDNRCYSFAVRNVELLNLEDIPPEGELWLDRFIEIEKGQYWIEAGSAIHVFTSSLIPSVVTFQIQAADDKPSMVSILAKDKEIERVILFGEESQKIELLTYQQGKNIFYFATDDCQEKIIEGQKRCIVAQIKDLKVELLE